MKPTPYSAVRNSFELHEWRGSGLPTLHVQHSDDEAWHVLEGELVFRYKDRIEAVGPGMTAFVPGFDLNMWLIVHPFDYAKCCTNREFSPGKRAFRKQFLLSRYAPNRRCTH